MEENNKQMEKALQAIYNWTDFVLKQGGFLSVAGTQKIKNMAAKGLEKSNDQNRRNKNQGIQETQKG